MPKTKIEGSLSGIVDKMNKAYDGLIGEGFNLGLDRRIVPEMVDGAVTEPFVTMGELIAYYKG